MADCKKGSYPFKIRSDRSRTDARVAMVVGRKANRLFSTVVSQATLKRLICSKEGNMKVLRIVVGGIAIGALVLVAVAGRNTSATSAEATPVAVETTATVLGREYVYSRQAGEVIAVVEIDDHGKKRVMTFPLSKVSGVPTPGTQMKMFEDGRIIFE